MGLLVSTKLFPIEVRYVEVPLKSGGTACLVIKDAEQEKKYEGSGGTAATAVTLDPLSAPVAISTTTTGQTLYQVDVSGFNQDVQASLTTGTATAVTISANYILVDGNDNPALGVGNQVIPIRKKVM